MQEFFENLFVPSVGLSLTVGSMLITMLFAILIGVIIAGGYMLVNRRDGYSSYFVTALLVLPAVIAIIIMMIGSNIARAFFAGRRVRSYTLSLGAGKSARYNLHMRHNGVGACVRHGIYRLRRYLCGFNHAFAHNHKCRGLRQAKPKGDDAQNNHTGGSRL